jgi:hypothetical protein
MTQQYDHTAHSQHADMTATDGKTAPPVGGHSAHGGHSWMMIACCIPMLVIAIALVATGVVSVGFLFIALACTAMMALMMRGMGGNGHGHDSPTPERVDRWPDR